MMKFDDEFALDAASVTEAINLRIKGGVTS